MMQLEKHINKFNFLKTLLILLCLSLSEGLFAETYTCTYNGAALEWSPENPFSGDTYIINEGDTVIYDIPTAALALPLPVENNGTLICQTLEIVFQQEYKQSSGELRIGPTAKFFSDADLSQTTISFIDDTIDHNLYLYKTTTSSDSSYINIKTPSASPLEFTTIYMGGNVNLTLNNALDCDNFYVVNGTTASDWAAEVDWAANIISSNSASYGLTVSNEFDINRFSATDGVLGYINLQTPFTFGGEALKIHSGAQLTVEENQTFTAKKVWISSYTSDLLTSFIVKGTANINTELDLGAESNPCAGKLIVEESGQLTVPHIFWTQETYRITDDTSPFTNNGTINVTTGISVITKDSNETELPLINNGTINASGGSSELSAAYFSGSGSINMAGGSLTASSSSKSSSIGKLNLSSSNEISALNLNCQQFIAESLGGESISFNKPAGAASQTLSVSEKLILSGSSASSLLTLTGDSAWNLNVSSLSASSTNFVTEYLDISNSTISQERVAFLSSDSGNNSNWLFDFDYTWTGAVSTSWEDTENWSPSLSYYPDYETYAVIIPDGLSRYPVLTASYTIKNLTVGTSTATSHDASITLGADNLILAESDGLTNYSDLIFTSTGRIADSLGNLLIDSSQGRVIYKSGSGSITAYDDGYYNLKIESGSWNNSESINVAGTFTNTATFTLNEELTVDGAFTNQGTLTIESGAPLTVKGDLVNSGSISQSDAVYCKGACENVTDTGSWTFSASAYIYFDADNSITFKSSSTSNRYNFDTSAASANTSFTGTSSGGQFLINSYTDGGQDLASFTNARFLNTAIYTKPLTVNKVTFDASNSFTSLNATGDVTFSAANTFGTLNLTGSAVFAATNSFENLNAQGSFTITFPAGSANSQNVTGSLILKGTSAGNLLTVKSPSSSSDDEDDCFYINYSGSLSDASLQYLNLKNAYNARMDGSSHENLTPDNSTDSGNNYYWNFLGAAYTWTGNSDKEWSNKNNWTPASVPGKGSLITIPSGKSKYPLLSSISGDIDIYYDTTYKGNLTIAASASMDFASYSFNAGTITNRGTIRAMGDSGQSLTATNKTSGANSTFAYYSSSIAEDVWDDTYNYLTFIEDAEGTISTALSVNKTTTINTSGSLSLSGTNTFTGNVILIAGEDITLNAASAFTIAANTGSTAQCKNLTVNSDVKLAGNLITESSMIFNQNLTLSANAKLQTTDDSGLITFVKNAGDATATNSASSLTIDSNLYFGQNAKANPSYLLISSSNAIDISSQSSSQINFACDLRLAEGSTATLSSPAKVSGDFTNAGTFNAESRLDLYADSVNSGSIIQTDEIYFNDGSSSVSDSGSWSIDADSYIHFANTSAEVTFTSSSSTNEYRFDTSSAGQPVNFEGSSASSKMIIKAYRDSYSSSSACDGCTFKNVNVSQGQTFTKDLIAIDAVLFSGENTFAGLTLKGNVEFKASDSFTSLTADGLGGKTITFPAGTAYSQTVTGSLTLKGTSTASLLTLKSSASSSDDEDDCFYINYSGSLDNASLQYLNLKNAYNARMDGSSHVNLAPENSSDSGNNYYWDFLGAAYTWTGNADTEWNNKNNWSPASVPGKGSLVTIPAGKTIYPLLTDELDLKYSSTYAGSLTIAASALIDFSQYNFTAGTIINNGRIRLKGYSSQTITAGTKTNGAASVIEYYGTSIAKDSWNYTYNNLSFTEDASGTISQALSVSGTTEFETTGSITLSGTNTFTGGVSISSADDITLNSASDFTLAENTSNSEQCNSLTINSAVTLAGNVITAESQSYKGDLTLAKNLTLKNTSGTGAISFFAKAGTSGSGTGTYTLTLDGNLYCGEDAVINPQQLNLSSASAITASSENDSQINIATKLSIISGTKVTLSSPVKISGTANNNGSLTLNKAATINGATTNAGTINVSAVTHIKNNLTNTGIIIQTANLYFDDSCTSVSDSRSWTIDDDSYIHFANTSAEVTFTSSSSANEYRFDTSSAEKPVNFAGSSASSKMIIKAYRDFYSSSSACDGCTFKNVNVSQGQTFTKNIIAKDSVLFSGKNKFKGLTIQGNNLEFAESNTFENLTAEDLGGYTITFHAGFSYSQTITESLTLKGTSEESGDLLTLKSSASSSDDEDDCFYINFTAASLDNATLQYLNLINAYNARMGMDGSSPENMTTKNSWDSGNNYYWNFLDALYTWTGEADTEWTNKNNWSPASVPGKGSLVTIPSVMTNYPLLTSTINILYDEDTYPGSLTIAASASMDFASYSFTAGTITNNGTIRAMGADGQTLTAEEKINGENSTFAYYSSSIEEDVWDYPYNYLTFIDDADGEIPDALTVNKTTTINTSGSVSLSGENTFTGNVILTAGEDIVLNSASGFTIAANTGSEAQCENLTVNSDVTLSGNLITQTSMTFNQNLILAANAKLQTTDDSGLITFVKKAGSGDAGTENPAYTLTIDSNLYFGQNAKANPLYLLLANTKDISIRAEETAEIAADLFIDTSKKVTFASSVNVENFYFYNGALTLNSDITLTCTKDFVTFGTNYDADDANYSGSDTRFAYYPQTQSGAIAYTLSNPLSTGTYTAAFSSLSGATIKTEGNLYINGSDLDGGTSKCTIIIPDNTSSNPVFNSGSSPTEDMWGIPYALVFNSTISNINIEDDTDNKSYLTASASLTDAANMGNTDGGNNTNVQFDYPRIVYAKTVYDDVIYLAFNLPLENSNGEINRNLEEAANKNQGGIWYNGQSLQLISEAYTDPDCENLLSENEDLTTPDSDDYYGFYIRVQEGSEKWNTDANGSASTSELAIDKNTKDDSCDSDGVHHDITVDLYYFEGLFTAAQGHTMALNQHYDQTEDKCDPVMLQVSTGREAHTDYSGSGSQAFYDAHNFIELRYSEAVDIGSLDAADADDDGNNNLQASPSFGDITQNSANGELIEGLTIAGLITTSDGSLEAYNKNDSTSPHSLYRTFPVDSSSETKLQTHRIRIGIAAYVDEANPVSFDSKEFNNWLGYIESSSAPEGSASLISENYVEIKDVNSNLLQRASTENHQITTSEMEISSYSDWDCIAPDFTLCWKRDEDQPADYFEILGTGSGSTIDRLEMHISDNQNTDDIFWATGYGWVYKEGREWVDEDSSYSADIIGGIRLSSIYNQYEKFKYGIGENSTPSLLFTGINPGASSSFFTGYRNEKTHNIPTTMDNPYFTFDVPSSDLTFDTEFTISYDETGSYITDLAGNRLHHSSQMTSIDRTPPKINICLASVGNNLLSIIFTKEIADSFTYTTNSGANNSGNLTDFLPYAIKFGKISGGNWTGISDLEIVEAVKVDNHSNSDFTTYTFQLNRNVTLEDIKTLSLRIESPNTTKDGITFEETAKDNFTGLTGSKVTILQDYLGNYIQMYSAHALSDFAINSINPLYAYDPDFVSDGESLSIFEGLYSDSEPQSHAVHDWSQNQTNFGTLPYGDDIVLIADTTDGDDNSNIPNFRMYLSARPVTNSTSNQYNTDLDENKRVWQPELDGYTYFNNLATLPNTVFDSLDKTSSPDFDTSDSAFENAVQYNIDVSELNNEWQNKDQVSFIFGLNNGSNPVTIVHSPEYLPETDNYDCHTSPLFALRLTEASNLLSFDLWSFRLNKISLQRGGVTILNNVINLTNNEKTVLKVNMASQGKLKVIVMTLDGNIIKYLENTNSTSGEHTYTWDGTNLNGKKVARGLYFIRVIGDDFDETRKVMCVK